jgi:luciferase family oxidoreductase group 1
MVRLSVLDQVPHFRGQTAAAALQESIALACEAEQLGYLRFWIAEHHNLGHFACGAPEILATVIAGQTTNIRVGTGGVMLPNYSPLKVAETFRLLSTLYPGRIDLGLGRSFGTDGATLEALRPYLPPGQKGEPDLYLQQVRALLTFLNRAETSSLDETNDPCFPGICAVPAGGASPDVWLLGSSQSSAVAAASLGLAFCFAQFVHAESMPHVLETYRQSFKPSRYL